MYMSIRLLRPYFDIGDRRLRGATDWNSCIRAGKGRNIYTQILLLGLQKILRYECLILKPLMLPLD